MEYEFEDAIAQDEGMSNKGDIDGELNELPSDGVNDRVSRLDLEITENRALLLKNLTWRKLNPPSQRS